MRCSIRLMLSFTARVPSRHYTDESLPWRCKNFRSAVDGPSNYAHHSPISAGALVWCEREIIHVFAPAMCGNGAGGQLQIALSPTAISGWGSAYARTSIAVEVVRVRSLHRCRPPTLSSPSSWVPTSQYFTLMVLVWPLLPHGTVLGVGRPFARMRPHAAAVRGRGSPRPSTSQ